jgi:hypothetical protein
MPVSQEAAHDHGASRIAIGPQTPERMMSPDATPRASISSPESSIYFSPDGIHRSGNLTEPRNYAPRTAGQAATQVPPPRFNLDLVAYQPQDFSSHDPSVVQAIQGRPLVVGTQMTVQQYDEAQAVKSESLSAMTNNVTRLPSLANAMNPNNFPFVESGKQVRPKNHGIVRLRNVCTSEQNSILR